MHSPSANSSNNLLFAHYQKADHFVLRLGGLLFLASLGLAFWHDTWGPVLLIGGSTLAACYLLVQLAAGQPLTRIALGASLMVYSALHIHQEQGATVWVLPEGSGDW